MSELPSIWTILTIFFSKVPVNMDNLTFFLIRIILFFMSDLPSIWSILIFFLNQSSGPNTSSEPEDRVLRISFKFCPGYTRIFMYTRFIYNDDVKKKKIARDEVNMHNSFFLIRIILFFCPTCPVSGQFWLSSHQSSGSNTKSEPEDRVFRISFEIQNKAKEFRLSQACHEHVCALAPSR